jgi:hypothetical protein
MIELEDLIELENLFIEEQLEKIKKQIEYGPILELKPYSRIPKCNKLDIIISRNYLTSLETNEKQFRAIDKIYDTQKPDGYLICIEENEEGTTQLNNMRQLLELDPIIGTGLPLDKNIKQYIWQRFNGDGTEALQTTFGTYYFINDVLTQTNMNLREFAKKLQLKYNDMLGLCSLGRHFCFCGRKTHEKPNIQNTKE